VSDGARSGPAVGEHVCPLRARVRHAVGVGAPERRLDALLAMFMRGGGIFTKAADVGAVLVGKVSSRSPRTIPATPPPSPTTSATAPGVADLTVLRYRTTSTASTNRYHRSRDAGIVPDNQGVVVRASPQELTGGVGVSEVTADLQRIGWGPVALNAQHDLGTDLFVQVRDARRFDRGLVVGVQVKGGPEWFKDPVRAEDGSLLGWWYYEPKVDHFGDWVTPSTPPSPGWKGVPCPTSERSASHGCAGS
jgi:Inorganic H+ pyrophosphatase/Domain of unknown function (DUF4365)